MSGDTLYLNKKMVCRRYGIAEGTLDQWVMNKKIPYIKIGERLVRFDVKVLDRWDKQQAVPPTYKPIQVNVE